MFPDVTGLLNFNLGDFVASLTMALTSLFDLLAPLLGPLFILLQLL